MQVKVFHLDCLVIKILTKYPDFRHYATLTGDHLVQLLSGSAAWVLASVASDCEKEEVKKQFLSKPENVARFTGEQLAKVLSGQGVKKEAIVQFLEYQDQQGQFSNILKLYDGTVPDFASEIRYFEGVYEESPLAGQAGINRAVVLNQLRHPKKVENTVEYIAWLCNTFPVEKVSTLLMSLQAPIKNKCIEDPIYLGQLLKILSADHSEFISQLLTPDFLRDALPTAPAFNRVMAPLDWQRRQLIYEAVGPRITDLIHSFDDFKLVADVLTPDQCKTLYREKKDKIVPSISTSQQLETVLKINLPGDYPEIIRELVQEVAHFFPTIPKYFQVSNTLQQDQRDALHAAMSAHFPGIVQSMDDVRVLAVIPAQEHNNFYTNMEKEWPRIVTEYLMLCSAFSTVAPNPCHP